MSVAYFVVFNKPASFDSFVSGKATASHEEVLAKLAIELGVKPLSDFLCVSEADFAALASDFDIPTDAAVPIETWFSPDDLLITVRALSSGIKKSSQSIPNADEILLDLAQYEEVLALAQKEKLACHLSVDY